MDQDNIKREYFDEDPRLKQEFFRYFSFWPYFLVSIIFSVIVAYFILRYSNDIYLVESKIEVVDKAQDSEMALPTAMTVFNRSMINLDNEIGVLSSLKLNEQVVKNIDFNVEFYTIGKIKENRTHRKDWFDDFLLELKIDADSLSKKLIFEIEVKNENLIISNVTDEENIIDYNFRELSTLKSNHNLPFDLQLNKYNNSQLLGKKKLVILPVRDAAIKVLKMLSFKQYAEESDQLTLSILHPNYQLAVDYLNTLAIEFDKDGILDRQREYRRTMDFVDSRSNFLLKELEKIELSKQNFKERNNLSDIKYDITVNSTQKFSYDSELFEAESQKDLANLLKSTITDDGFSLMPVDIGVKNETINKLILEYNTLISDYERYSDVAGPNNTYILNLKKQINDFSENILISIDNYIESLELLVSNIQIKEKEFDKIFQKIPENEKILRSIERELEVKESLFLLLLQKREEAAINLAVVKPSIKLIDYARGSIFPVSPNKKMILFLCVLAGFSVPLFYLYVKFFIDNKIHSRDDLQKNINQNVGVLGEVPYLKNLDEFKIFDEKPSSRHPVIEASRMIITNLKFSAINFSKENNKILVTSVIKGEGKTFISSAIATVLAHKFDKVLLIGADLRNPQIHKILGVDKSKLGLSDFIYRNDLKIEDLFIKRNNLDILLSGTIPPNPIDLLTSKKFKNTLDELSKKYDYVVIDSAPCLLVADTFEISKEIPITLNVFRANFTDKKLCEFINECYEKKKLNSINLVFNGVGNSSSYGYKYGYQYGYRYGYKYGYNYGYGYGYGSKEDSN